MSRLDRRAFAAARTRALRVLGSLGVSVLCWLAWAGDAQAVTYNHTVCIRLNTGFVDAPTGDFGTTSPWYGRGVKFKMYGSTLRYAGDDSATSSGCTTFSSPDGGLASVTIYAEAKVGGTGNITVRAFSTSAAMTTFKNNPTDANLQKWSVVVVPSCVGTTCTSTITVGGAADVVSNLLAAALWSVHRVDGQTSPRVAGPQVMYLHNSGCDGAQYGSCGGDPNLEIQPGWDGARRKFLIGHEVGHWFQQVWGGGAAGGYDIWRGSTLNSLCRSQTIPGEHAMGSLEWQSGAFGEGFAHFVSALTYNDHAQTNGEFKYYKDYTEAATDYTFDLVDVENSGNTDPTFPNNSWRNRCACGTVLPPPTGDPCTWPGGGSPPEDEHASTDLGVEVDWLRAYWDYRTNAPSNTRPTHWQIFQHLVATYFAYGLWNTKTTYPDLRAVLADPDRVPSWTGFLPRWDQAFGDNGAAH